MSGTHNICIPLGNVLLGIFHRPLRTRLILACLSSVHCPARCANAYHRVYGTSVYRGVSASGLSHDPHHVLRNVCREDHARLSPLCLLSQDSNICAAAIHAGVILNEGGGDCTLLKVEGQDFYPGSTRNGITSLQ